MQVFKRVENKPKSKMLLKLPWKNVLYTTFRGNLDRIDGYRSFCQPQLLLCQLHLFIPVINLLGPISQHETRDGQLDLRRGQPQLHHCLIMVAVLQVVKAH